MEKNSPWLSWPMIGLVVMLGAAMTRYMAPLQSSRPRATLPFEGEDDRGAVESPLWQDPLQAAVEHDRKSHGKGHSVENDLPAHNAWGRPIPHDVRSLHQEVLSAQKGRDGKATIVHVLFVLTHGGQSANDHERRIRSRYAVQSALSASGFRPADSDHLHYVKMPWPTRDELPNSLFKPVAFLERAISPFSVWLGATLPTAVTPVLSPRLPSGSADLTIPYEWFDRDDLYPRSRNGQSADGSWYVQWPEKGDVGSTIPTARNANVHRVLVLWLPQTKVEDRPFARFEFLAKRLVGKASSPPSTTVRLDVIGPVYSDDLRTMLAEAAQYKPEPPHLPLKDRNVRVFSSWATLPAEVVAYGLVANTGGNPLGGDKLPTDSLLESTFKGIKIPFVPCTATDELLANQLVAELKRRGINVHGDETNRVALVCEWDTFYGRAFPLIFAAADGLDKSNFRDNLAEILRTKLPSNVRTYAYLRGVDGLHPAVPDEERSAARSSSDAPPDPRRGEPPNVAQIGVPEVPAGHHQLDYVRRLAQKIADDYRTVGGSRELKAIGVVGTDIYDKILIIQALREHFNDVVFFTTDLDARLYYRQHIGDTRNLVVASSFGLQLHDAYQHGFMRRRTAEFRDSYQTALFFACRTALGLRNYAAGEKAFTADEVRNAVRDPRLFEIGRERAVDISIARKKSDESISPKDSLHPPVHNADPFDQSADEWWPYFARPALLFLFTGLVGLAILALRVSTLRRLFIKGAAATELDSNTEITPSPHDGCLNRMRRTSYAWIVSTSAMLGLAMFAAIVVDHYRDGGEPFSLLDGVSVWPQVIVRYAVIVVGAVLLVKIYIALARNNFQLADDFGLGPARGMLGEKCASPGSLRDANDKQVVRAWQRVFVDFWFRPERQGISAVELWREYQQWGAMRWRLLRSGVAAGLFLLSIVLVSALYGFPYVSARSLTPRMHVQVISLASVIVSTWAVFLVFDATLLCRRMMRHLESGRTTWPEKATQFAGKAVDRRRSRALPSELREWLDIRFVAKRTEAISGFAYYPSVLLLLMLISRMAIFDQVTWPPATVLLYAVNFLCLFGCAFGLWQGADRTRRKALAVLTDDLANARLSGRNDDRVKAIEWIRDQIKNTHDGAFQPLSSNPLVKVVLIPPSGMSLLALGEAWLNWM